MTENLIQLLKLHRQWILDGSFVGENGIPDHECEYKINPEKGTCDFCEMWAEGSEAVNVIIEKRMKISHQVCIPKEDFEKAVDEFTSYWDSGKTHMGDEYSILEKLLSKYIKVIDENI